MTGVDSDLIQHHTLVSLAEGPIPFSQLRRSSSDSLHLSGRQLSDFFGVSYGLCQGDFEISTLKVLFSYSLLVQYDYNVLGLPCLGWLLGLDLNL